MEVATERLLNQQVKYCFSAMFMHGTASLQLISGGVNISEVPGCHLLRQMSSHGGHKNYFKDLCLMNSQPTFLFLTYLNLMNYDHIIKSM